MTELKNKAIAGVKWTTIATVISTAMQLGQLLVLSRLLSPRDFGLMAFINVVILFIRSFSDLGISSAVIHYQDTTKEQLSTLYWMNLIVGAFLFLGMLALSPVIVLIFNEPETKNLLLLSSFSLVVLPVGSMFQVLLQKELKFNLLAKQDIVSIILSTTATVTLAFLKLGVWALVIGQLVNIFIKTIMLFYSGLQDFRIERRFSLHAVRNYLYFGFYQIGERGINFLSERIDQLIIGSMLGASTLGYYNFAFNLVNQPVSVINPIFSKVAFPILAKLQSDIPMLRNAYLKLLKYIAVINSVILIGLIVSSPIAVPLIFGNKWNESIILVQILSVVALLRSFANPVGCLILAKGRADLGFKWNVLLLVISVVTIYFVSKLGSVQSIAISLILIQILLFFPSYKYLVEVFIGKCFSFYIYNLFAPVLYGLVMAIALLPLFLMKAYFPFSVLLLLQVSLGAMIYIYLIKAFDKNLFIEIKDTIRSRPDVR